MSRVPGAVLLLALAAGTCACAGRSDPATPLAEVPGPDWQRLATPADRSRLRGWRTAWTSALPRARAANPAAIAAEGVLFDPDRALPNPMPPAGAYRCRTFKLGAQRLGGLDFIAYPFFDCRVSQEGDVLSLHKRSGSQRPAGLILPDRSDRAVFLGTLVLGDERAPLTYGRDASRDMAGLVERVAPGRWRLVLPYPRFESTLDVLELVPAG